MRHVLPAAALLASGSVLFAPSARAEQMLQSTRAVWGCVDPRATTALAIPDGRLRNRKWVEYVHRTGQCALLPAGKPLDVLAHQGSLVLLKAPDAPDAALAMYVQSSDMSPAPDAAVSAPAEPAAPAVAAAAQPTQTTVQTTPGTTPVTGVPPQADQVAAPVPSPGAAPTPVPVVAPASPAPGAPAAVDGAGPVATPGTAVATLGTAPVTAPGAPSAAATPDAAAPTPVPAAAPAAAVAAVTTPTVPTPVAPTPVAPTPVAPTPVAPTPVAPVPLAPGPTSTDTAAAAPAAAPTQNGSSGMTWLALIVVLALLALVGAAVLVSRQQRRFAHVEGADWPERDEHVDPMASPSGVAPKLQPEPTPQTFRKSCIEVLEQGGWTIQPSFAAGASREGGPDILGRRRDAVLAVRCRGGSATVTPEIIDEVAAMGQAARAHVIVLATPAPLTRRAHDEAMRLHVHVLDQGELSSLSA